MNKLAALFLKRALIPIKKKSLFEQISKKSLQIKILTLSAISAKYRGIFFYPHPHLSLFRSPFLFFKLNIFTLYFSPCYDGLNKDEKVILWRKSWHI